MSTDTRETLAILLETSCRTGNAEALLELLMNATASGPQESTGELVKGVLRVASENGHVHILQILRDWSSEVITRDLAEIAQASVTRYWINQGHEDAERVYTWWVDNVTVDSNDNQLLRLLFIWGCAVNTLNGLRTLNQRYGIYIPWLINDETSRSDILTAALSSRLFVEICEMLSVSSLLVPDFLHFLLMGHIEETLTDAVQKNDLEVLHYLIQRLDLSNNTAPPSLPFWEASVNTNNLAAALLLRTNGAPIPTSRPEKLSKHRSGQEEWKRRAILVLFDEAWEVMQRVQRAEMRRVFEQAWGEVQRAKERVKDRIERVREMGVEEPEPEAGLTPWDPAQDCLHKLVRDRFLEWDQESFLLSSGSGRENIEGLVDDTLLD
jgi:hypothetical protein